MKTFFKIIAMACILILLLYAICIVVGGPDGREWNPMGQYMFLALSILSVIASFGLNDHLKTK